MEYLKLYGKIEEKIAAYEKKYEKVKNVVYDSTVCANELETWQFLLERVKEGEGKEDAVSLRTYLRERLDELEKEKEREEYCPSFSWYGEHYYYLVFEGQCNAYRGLLELLEEMETEQTVREQEETGQRAPDL